MAIVLNGTTGITTPGLINSGDSTVTGNTTFSSSSYVGIGLTPTSRNNAHLQLLDGIAFPATQVPSSDANVLDDYEEGTWSPYYSTIGGDYTGTTSFNATGYYIKIGKQVTVIGSCATAGVISGGSGQTIIKGLPFSVVSTGTGSIWVNPDTGTYGSPTALPTVLQGNSTYINLSKSGTTNNPAFTELLKSGGNANQMYFSLTYITSN